MKLQIVSILTFLVTCKAVTVSPSDTVIAQIATGGPWKTSIELVNLGTKPALYTVNFYDDSGAAPTLVRFAFCKREDVISEAARRLAGLGATG